LAAGKNTVVKDSEGNIIETGLFDMIESKGMKVTYDQNGNLIIIKEPKLKRDIKIGYQVKSGDREEQALSFGQLQQNLHSDVQNNNPHRSETKS
jgi:hypothetical protein